jgi:hypothetical protein
MIVVTRRRNTIVGSERTVELRSQEVRGPERRLVQLELKTQLPLMQINNDGKMKPNARYENPE